MSYIYIYTFLRSLIKDSSPVIETRAPRKGIAGEWKKGDIVVPVAESEALNAKAKIVANTMERQLRLDFFRREIMGILVIFFSFIIMGIPQNSWTVCLQWMIWGYYYCRKPPHIHVIYMSFYITSDYRIVHILWYRQYTYMVHTLRYLYIYISIYLYMYTYLSRDNQYLYIYIHTCVIGFKYACLIYIYIYTYIHIHTHTHTYTHIHTHTYTYIHIHTHTYTYIYIHIHT